MELQNQKTTTQQKQFEIQNLTKNYELEISSLKEQHKTEVNTRTESQKLNAKLEQELTLLSNKAELEQENRRKEIGKYSSKLKGNFQEISKFYLIVKLSNYK